MLRMKWAVMLPILLILTMISGGPAFAFNDLTGTAGKDDIIALANKGIIHGVTDTTFAPQDKLSSAQGVALMVKGFDLNIDNLRFIKKPEAADYFTQIPNDAWYAQAFIIANLNGLQLPKDVDPNQAMTREEFASYVIEQLNATGDYPIIDLYMLVKDENEMDKADSSLIQQALIMKIATLDKDQKFHPKQAITRAEAAVMIYRALDFIATHSDNANVGGGANTANPVDPNLQGEVSFEAVPVSSAAVSTAVNQVVLTWKQAPNPGYSIQIDRIEFQDNLATIYYSRHKPDPDKMFAQVLTDLKATTYVDAAFKVQIAESGGTVGSPPSRSTTIQ